VKTERRRAKVMHAAAERTRDRSRGVGSDGVGSESRNTSGGSDATRAMTIAAGLRGSDDGRDTAESAAMV
jgi:hypothetical protein